MTAQLKMNQNVAFEVNWVKKEGGCCVEWGTTEIQLPQDAVFACFGVNADSHIFKLLQARMAAGHFVTGYGMK